METKQTTDWSKDSSLETWFPLTEKELATLRSHRREEGMKSIEEIKRDCSLVADGLLIPEDAFTPQAAKALLLAIEGYEDDLLTGEVYRSKQKLESIRALFL